MTSCLVTDDPIWTLRTKVYKVSCFHLDGGCLIDYMVIMPIYMVQFPAFFILSMHMHAVMGPIKGGANLECRHVVRISSAILIDFHDRM